MNRSDVLLRHVASGLERTLAPSGFRRKRMSFVRDTGEVLQLFGLQRGTSSDASYLRVTLNVGLSAKVLTRPGERGPDTTSDCQAQFRLSQLMPGPFEDRWWGVVDEHEADLALEEMRTRLVDVALPALNSLMAGKDLLREWSDGGDRRLAPGAEFDRIRFVEALRERLGGT